MSNTEYYHTSQYLWTAEWLDGELGWVHATLTLPEEHVSIEEAEAIQKYLDSEESINEGCYKPSSL